MTINVVTTSRPILETLTDRELYRLAFEVSEILTEREMMRQYGIREAVVGLSERLEYLRGEIQAERISYGEIAELQGLAHAIHPSDVELLEWAGVPEFDNADDRYGAW